jgi:PTH1 family peptidyl-tRNA hydrolase
MPEGTLQLVVGLGNPGSAYRHTRHNAGFQVVDKLAAIYGIALDRKRFKTLFGRGRIEIADVILAQPLDFMNNSGPPVKQLAGYHAMSTKAMLVVHDDIDLEFGRLKIKEKGGHGGHNGLKSLIHAFGGGEFARLRIGIGRPPAGIDATVHVLGRFSRQEAAVLDSIIGRACDAAACVLTQGLAESMNRFNDKRSVVGS